MVGYHNSQKGNVIMNKITANFYNKKKDNIDISDANFIRIETAEGYFDIRIKDNMIDINAEYAISILPNGGCNSINIAVRK